MTREEIIRDFVLMEICDDYENVDQIIFPHVSRDLVAAGIQVERREIVEALTSLVAKGLATVHRLTESPAPLPEVPSLEMVEDGETGYEVYFLVTDAGREHHDHSEILGVLFDDPISSKTRTMDLLHDVLSDPDIASLRKHLAKS